MAKDKEPLVEINIPHPYLPNEKAVAFVPRSQAIRDVETGKASWPTRTLSFEEQMHTPMVGVVVSQPNFPTEKTVKFIPAWQAQSMIKTGQAELLKKSH